MARTCPTCVLRRVEYLEASGCNLLAVTVAWDAAHGPASSSPGRGAAATVGFSSLEAAVMDAQAALAALRAPAPPSAGAFKLQRGGSAHQPDSSAWETLMDGVHADLNAAATAAAEARANAEALADPERYPEIEGHGEAWAPRWVGAGPCGKAGGGSGCSGRSHFAAGWLCILGKCRVGANSLGCSLW